MLKSNSLIAGRSSIVQSTALAPRLRSNIAQSAARYASPAPAASAQYEFQTQAALWQSLTRYIEGWGQADPKMIARAAADGYRFHDPLVGVFSRQRLARYFTFLHARFDCPGVPSQPTFYLHGPMDGRAAG